MKVASKRTKQRAHKLLVSIGITPELKAYEYLYYILVNKYKNKEEEDVIIYARLYRKYGINYDHIYRNVQHAIRKVPQYILHQLVGKTKATPIRFIKSLQKVFALGIELEIKDE